MDNILYIIMGILLGVVLAGVASWLFFKKMKDEKDDKDSDKNNQGFLLLQNQMEMLAKTVDTKLSESQKDMNLAMRSQFTESQKLVKEITEELTSVKETNKQVVGFADQLQSLQDILKNPKQRGILGEYYLETVLQNVLAPEGYKMQYKFSSGEIVDAVVFLDKKKILPIDSKFSLENYNKILESRDAEEREILEKVFKQDLKKRIDETSKYIKPKEGTMDFAFMFIPSEAIYYDLLVNRVGAVKTSTRDLIEYAFIQKKVVIVSPTSFLAYLQTIKQGLRSLEIEERATEIIKRVGELGRHLGNHDTFMQKLGNSLSATVGNYNIAHKELGKIDKDVVRITGESSDISVLQIEKPSQSS